MNTYSHIEEIIAKHLAGECTAAEEQLLSNWLEESEVNQNYYNSLKTIFQQSAVLKTTEVVDTDAAWNLLKVKIQSKKTASRQLLFLNNSEFRRIAAIMLLAAGIGIALYIKFNTSENPVIIAAESSVKAIVLPDSSKILLNKNSSVQYAFSGKKREVILKGEAFFEVTHDENNPFTVKSGGLVIKDIGTAFNVRSINADSIEVIVEEGEVALTAANSVSLNLIKGERSIYSRIKNTITKLSPADPNALSYITKIFVFENANLEIVVTKLNEVYGSNILINDNLKNCRFTSTFNNEKLNTIIDIIVETFQLKIIKNNNQIILEGQGCEK